MSFLGLYRDPVVAAVTSRCDWRIADLIADPSRRRLSGGAALGHLADQAAHPPRAESDRRRLTEDLHAKDRRHRVLMLLDEFPALGRLDFLESSLAFLAGYGSRASYRAEPQPDRKGVMARTIPSSTIAMSG
jgi:type IV secretion system protein VirD4